MTVQASGGQLPLQKLTTLQLCVCLGGGGSSFTLSRVSLLLLTQVSYKAVYRPCCSYQLLGAVPGIFGGRGDAEGFLCIQYWRPVWELDVVKFVLCLFS